MVQAVDDMENSLANDDGLDEEEEPEPSLPAPLLPWWKRENWPNKTFRPDWYDGP